MKKDVYVDNSYSFNKMGAFEDFKLKGKAKHFLWSWFPSLWLQCNTNVSRQWQLYGDPWHWTCFKKNIVDRPAVSVSWPLCSPCQQLSSQMCLFFFSSPCQNLFLLWFQSLPYQYWSGLLLDWRFHIGCKLDMLLTVSTLSNQKWERNIACQQHEITSTWIGSNKPIDLFLHFPAVLSWEEMLKNECVARFR